MKFDFIPLELYTIFYYYAILLVVIVYFFKLQEKFKQSNFGYLFVWILIIYMGFRPLSGKWFGDMYTYNRMFLSYQNGANISSTADLFFNIFVKFCSGVMSADFFFLLCAFVYIYPLYIVSKKWFDNYWFYSFLLLIASFSFWAYGTNGIRNGIAASLFLLGLSRSKKMYQILWIILAINFHKTMLLPAMGILLASIYNQPKKMIAFWLACIPISLLVGSTFEIFIANLGLFEDDRLSYLTEGNVNNDKFSSTGFRWDFLIYSSTAVFAGWYFIIKKEFKDRIYYSLFNTYVFANAFWILVIRANFSNRFAYLSWFMMALVIVYPFLKKRMFENQSKVFAIVLLAYFLFTYLMNVLLLK